MRKIGESVNVKKKKKWVQIYYERELRNGIWGALKSGNC